jgi:hypothetical protein
MTEPKLFCTVYRMLARDETNATGQVLQHPPLLELSLPITGKVTSSDQFPTYSRFIELVAEEDCFIAIENNPSEPKHFIQGGERLTYGCLESMCIGVKHSL